MKKHVFFLSLLSLLCFDTALAQQSILISGIVKDSSTKTPLEYASIVFTQEEKVLGGITNQAGKFEIEIPKGTYQLQVEYLGFETYQISNLNLQSNIQLEDILLREQANALDGVELVGEKTEVEVRLDKRIYNVGKDITVRGGSVADVLDNVPAVSVDIDGNVALRGNSNVRILINGKPSGLVGLSGPQGLQQIPAESIEKVEVVTAPSARYDAQGTAGILNIILKREKLLGINGNIVLNGGVPENYGGSLSANWRKGNWNLFNTSSWNKNTSETPGESRVEYFNGDQPSTFLEEDRTYTRDRNNAFTNIGLEYYYSEKNSISISGFIRDSDRLNGTDNYISNFDAQGNNTNRTLRQQSEDELDASRQLSLNWDHNFNDDGHKLTATIQLEKSQEDEIGNITNFPILPARTDPSLERIETYEDQKQDLVQLDYVWPIDENTQFELGYRGTFETQETDYKVSYLQDDSYTLDSNLSNVLEYVENVHAAYSQYGKKIERFSFLVGLRMEASHIEVNQKTTNDYVTKEYVDWFPTLNISYEFEETKSMTLGISRRIQRPWSRSLNPFPSRNSATNLWQGNPDLDPSYSSSFDLGYLHQLDKITLNGSVYYQNTTGVVNYIQEDTGETVEVGDPAVEVPVLRSNPVNLSENNRIGAEGSISYNPNRKSRYSINANFFRSETLGSYNGTVFDATNISWFVRFNSYIRLPKDFNWQMRVFYRGPRENAQTKRSGVASLSGAINKNLFDNKATISLRVRNLFNLSKSRSETRTPSFASEGLYQRGQQQFVMSFTFRVNQQDNKRKRQGGNGNGGDYGGDGAEEF
ncbi:MAG: TonB-dependent receptor domain-containing protein [Flavobacteriaceae bacterium]